MDVVESAVRFVRGLGVVVDEPVMLRSTNNVVAWLSPSDVVAKISGGGQRLGDELSIASALHELGAPIVPRHHRLGDRLHDIAGHDVTFWTYLPQDGALAVSSEELAVSLGSLHSALDRFAGRPGLTIPSIRGELVTTVMSLDDSSFAPELRSSDRALLRDRLTHLASDLPSVGLPVIHGSPHRSNVLSNSGEARFIDFETVSLGPIEWDLAHLEPAVAERYGKAVDVELLARCRIVISAKTAAHCWASRDRGPDMRWHADHHLAVVRASRS